jgi:hypothetical protein
MLFLLEGTEALSKLCVREGIPTRFMALLAGLIGEALKALFVKTGSVFEFAFRSRVVSGDILPSFL